MHASRSRLCAARTCDEKRCHRKISGDSAAIYCYQHRHYVPRCHTAHAKRR